MVKKIKKDAINLTKVGLGIGVGGATLGALSSKSGVALGGGLASAASFMPTIVGVGMAGNTLRLTKKMSKSYKKSSRRKK